VDFHFSSELHDEVFYVEKQLKQVPLFKKFGYKVSWPQSLQEKIESGINEFAREEIERAIQAHDLPGADLAKMEQGWRAIEADINAQFISKLDVPLPKFVRVHVTKFGPGGSHNGAPMLPVLTVGFPQMKGFNFNTVVVHELIEIFVHKRFLAEREKNPDIHPLKEAVVDKFCSCNELTEILGAYRKQPNFNTLPDDWRSWLPTKQFGDLTW
jgi:hypothetical protein